jgi:hypothetical protein
MKIANISTKKSNEAIVIERKLVASRKKRRLCPLTAGDEPMKKMMNEENYDDSIENVSFWRNKYDELYRETISLNNDLEKQLEMMRDRSNEMEKCIHLYEEKLKKVECSSTFKKDRMIEFYELMTNMTINLEQKDELDEFSCTVKNDVSNEIARFLITWKKLDSFNKKQKLEESSDAVDNQLDEIDLNEVSFQPLSNTSVLPNYLQADICFERRMAPVIMGDILQQMYVDEEG